MRLRVTMPEVLSNEVKCIDCVDAHLHKHRVLIPADCNVGVTARARDESILFHWPSAVVAAITSATGDPWLVLPLHTDAAVFVTTDTHELTVEAVLRTIPTDNWWSNYQLLTFSMARGVGRLFLSDTVNTISIQPLAPEPGSEYLLFQDDYFLGRFYERVHLHTPLTGHLQLYAVGTAAAEIDLLVTTIEPAVFYSAVDEVD